MRLLSFLGALVLTTGLVSCSEESKNQSATPAPTISTQVIQEIDELRHEVALGYVLKRAATDEKDSIQTQLTRAKTAILRLQSNPKDQGALRVLNDARRAIAAFKPSEQDRSRFEELERRLGQVALYYAEKSQMTLNEAGYTLFSYNFSNGLEPFISYGSFSTWSTDWKLDRGFATAGGFGNETSLISPQFDLSEVQNPRLEIRHILMIDRNKREAEFDRRLFLNEAFKVMVSTTYKGGEPNWNEWDRLPVDELPSSFDFHTLTSPPIDLSAYREKNVSIALLFDTTHESMGKHYVSWQVENFEILGSSPNEFSYTEQPQPEPEATPLFTQSFEAENLEPFSLWGKGSAQWHFYAHGDKRYAKASSNNEATETWLISPHFDLKEAKNLKLEIQHTINSLIWDQAEVLISKDYAGGNTPESANWESLPIKPDFETPDGSWIDLRTELFDLKAYESIVIAFRFTSTENDRHTWEIEHINFYGEGKISVVPLAQGAGASNPVESETPQPKTREAHKSKNGETRQAKEKVKK